MADVEDVVDPTESHHSKPGDLAHTGGAIFPYVAEHICWVLSRAALLAFIVIVMVKFDIPLRSLFEGDALKQLQTEKQKAVLDEVQLLRDIKRQLDEMTVALSTLKSLSQNYQATRDEFARARDRFTNATNRFDEQFFSRRNSLTDEKLEHLLYEIRDTSRRISDNLMSTDDKTNSRKLNIQTDLIEKQISNVPFLIEKYICKRSEQAPSLYGKCL